VKKLLHLSYDYVLKHASNQMFKLELSIVESFHGSMVKKLLNLMFLPGFFFWMKFHKFQPENYDFQPIQSSFHEKKVPNSPDFKEK
jgi:hypothetical protein